jgi:hypothetical protein
MEGALVRRVPKDPAEHIVNRAQLKKSCSVCQEIADFVTRRMNGSHDSKFMGMGIWQQFLNNRQCVCCQKVVQCLSEDTIRIGQKIEASCPLRFIGWNV